MEDHAHSGWLCALVTDALDTRLRVNEFVELLVDTGATEHVKMRGRSTTQKEIIVAGPSPLVDGAAFLLLHSVVLFFPFLLPRGGAFPFFGCAGGRFCVDFCFDVFNQNYVRMCILLVHSCHSAQMLISRCTRQRILIHAVCLSQPSDSRQETIFIMVIACR